MTPNLTAFNNITFRVKVREIFRKKILFLQTLIYDPNTQSYKRNKVITHFLKVDYPENVWSCLLESITINQATVKLSVNVIEIEGEKFISLSIFHNKKVQLRMTCLNPDNEDFPSEWNNYLDSRTITQSDEDFFLARAEKELEKELTNYV